MDQSARHVIRADLDSAANAKNSLVIPALWSYLTLLLAQGGDPAQQAIYWFGGT